MITKHNLVYYSCFLYILLHFCKCHAQAVDDDLCDNYSCARHHGVICNGSPCHCGICHCNPGRSGLTCELRIELPSKKNDDNEVTTIATTPLSKVLDKEKEPNPRKKFCLAPGSLKICSGNGQCVDNECLCHGEFDGEFCEICPTCHKHKCKVYKTCIHCLLTTIDCDEECQWAPRIEFVDMVKNDGEGDLVYCQLTEEKDPRDCRFYFVFGHDDHTGQDYIRAQNSTDCSKQGSPSNSASFKFNTLIIIWTTFLISPILSFYIL